jgi:hypothetical protein
MERLAGTLGRVREIYPGHGDMIDLDKEEGRLPGIRFA